MAKKIHVKNLYTHVEMFYLFIVIVPLELLN